MCALLQIALKMFGISGRILCSLLLLTGVFVAIGASDLYAQTSRIYFAGYMGLNTTNDNKFSESSQPVQGDFEYDNAPTFAGALGFRFSRKFRAEAELSYRKKDLNNVDFAAGNRAKIGGEMKSWMLLLNGYYDFDEIWSTQPYVTLGLGVAHHDGEIDGNGSGLTSTADTSTGLGWQIGGGMKYRVNPDLALTGGYRYIGSSDIKFDTYEIEYSAHEFRVGLEYDFSF